MSIEQVSKALKKYSHFLITSHFNAEGDALGSTLALASLLRKMGKRVEMVNSDSISFNYAFLPGVHSIAKRPRSSSFEAVCVVDCPILKRIGAIAEFIKDKPLIVIDHHIDNKKFGQVNWVDPRASSVGEMVYSLFKRLKVSLDKKDALNIYIAMLTDTGSFRHANTTSNVLHTAAELLKFGLEPSVVYSRIYEQNSLEEMRNVARVILGFSFEQEDKIAWVELSKAMCRAVEWRNELLEKVFDFARSISPVKVAIVFSHLGADTLKVSFRSKPSVNVQKIAGCFGGGGHKCASGCRIQGDLREMQQKVLAEVKKAVR
ncbi:MAG: bifunctional oligoribonuclease/PAP phosphatase NrnA [Candidatus Omnitrophota bacterium]